MEDQSIFSEFILDKITTSAWSLMLIALLIIQIASSLRRLVLLVVFIMSTVIKTSLDVVSYFPDSTYMTAVYLILFIIVFSTLCFLMAYIVNGLLEEIASYHAYAISQDAYFKLVVNQQMQGFIVIQNQRVLHMNEMMDGILSCVCSLSNYKLNNCR